MQKTNHAKFMVKLELLILNPLNEMNKRDINVFFNPVDFPSSHSLRGLPSQKIIEIYNYFKSATIVPYINPRFDATVAIKYFFTLLY